MGGLESLKNRFFSFVEATLILAKVKGQNIVLKKVLEDRFGSQFDITDGRGNYEVIGVNFFLPSLSYIYLSFNDLGADFLVRSSSGIADSVKDFYSYFEDYTANYTAITSTFFISDTDFFIPSGHFYGTYVEDNLFSFGNTTVQNDIEKIVKENKLFGKSFDILLN